MVLLGIIASYLLGAIPTAYLFVRFLKGEDIRKLGSGNVGATNAYRVLGSAWAVFILLLDTLKGLLPVTFLASQFVNYWDFSSLSLRIIFGVVAISGHNWTLFLRFKGGKGVATSIGVIIGLSTVIIDLRLILFLIMIIWLLVFIIFRIVSLASILSAVSFPIFMVIFKQPVELLILAFILSFFIILRHKKNLLRLWKGQESRLSFKTKKT